MHARAGTTFALIALATLAAGCRDEDRDRLRVFASVVPSVTLDGETTAVRGVVTLTATVDDFADLERFQWEIDGALVGAPIPGPAGGQPVPLDLVVDTALSLADGLHRIAAVARDDEGGTARKRFTVLVDNAAPSSDIQPVVASGATQVLSGFVVTIADRPPLPTPNSGVHLLASEPEIEFTSAATGATTGLTPGADYTIAVQTSAGNPVATYTIDLLRTDDGVYRIFGVATDRVGNATTYDETIRSDIRAPIVSFEQPAMAAFVSGGNVVVRADDAELQTLALFRLDPSVAPAARTPVPPGAIARTGTVTTLTIPVADVAATSPPSNAEGPISLLAQATDLAGNIAEARLDFQYDPTPPAATIVAPASGSHLNSAAIQLSGTVTETLGLGSLVATLVWSGGTVTAYPIAPPAPGAGSQPFSTTLALGEDAYTATVTATDLAGNATASAPVSFVVDRTAPTISGSPSDILAPVTDFTQSFSLSDMNGFQSVQVTAAPGTATISRSGSARTVDVTYTGLVANGTTFSIEIQATDPAGNVALRTFTFLVDNVRPTIAGLAPAGGARVSDDPVFLSSTVTDAAGVTYTISGPVSVTAFVPGPDAIADFLLPEGDYTVAAAATDANGNAAAGTLGPNPFTVDRTAPAVRLANLPVGPTNSAAALANVTLAVDDGGGEVAATLTVLRNDAPFFTGTVGPRATIAGETLGSLFSLPALPDSAQTGDLYTIHVDAEDVATRIPNRAARARASFVYDNQNPRVLESSLDGSASAGRNRRAIAIFNESLDTSVSTAAIAGGFTVNGTGVATNLSDMAGFASVNQPTDTVFVVAPELHPEGATLEFDPSVVRDLAGNSGVSDSPLAATVVADASGPRLAEVETTFGGTPTRTPVTQTAMFGTSSGVAGAFFGITIEVDADTAARNQLLQTSDEPIVLVFDEDVDRLEDVRITDKLDEDVLLDEALLAIDPSDRRRVKLLPFGGWRRGERYRISGIALDENGNRAPFELFVTAIRELQDTTPPGLTAAFGTVERGPIYLGLTEGIAMDPNTRIEVTSGAGAVPEFRVAYEHGRRNALRLDPVGGPWPASVTIGLFVLADLSNSTPNVASPLATVSVPGRANGYDPATFLAAAPVMASDPAFVDDVGPRSVRPAFELQFSAPLDPESFVTEGDGANVRLFENFRGTGTWIPVLGIETRGTQALRAGLSANGIDPLADGTAYRVEINGSNPTALDARGNALDPVVQYFRTARLSENPIPDLQRLTYRTQMDLDLARTLRCGDLASGIRAFLTDRSDPPDRDARDRSDVGKVLAYAGGEGQLLEGFLQAGVFTYATPGGGFEIEPGEDEFPGEGGLFGLDFSHGERPLDLEAYDVRGTRLTAIPRLPYLFEGPPSEVGSFPDSTTWTGQVSTLGADLERTRFVVIEVTRFDPDSAKDIRIVYTALAAVDDSGNISFTPADDLPANADETDSNLPNHRARWVLEALDLLDNESVNRCMPGDNDNFIGENGTSDFCGVVQDT